MVFSEISVAQFFHAEYFDPAMHWQLEALDVVVEVLDDVRFRHEAIRIVAVVFRARHAHLEVGRYQREGIPALMAPCMRNRSRSFQHNMPPPFLLQVITDGKTSLAATDDDGIDSL